jgi:osmotically-inducible protein OsmY
MNGRVFLTTSFVALVLLVASCGQGQPPVIQSHQDGQGNTHIDINNQQIKKDLSQAGTALQDGAKTVAQNVKSGAEKFRDSDAAISAVVKTRLTAAPDLGGLHISVETVDGKVTLRGAVKSQDRKENAAQIAARTDGVKAVDNQLTVDPNS